MLPCVAMSNPLRKYRDENELSQQEVADKLGISRSMVGFLENEEREFTLDMALLVEKKLGIDRATTLPKLFKREAA